ncbi:hypothetical protein MTHERMOG20_07270 [Moorella thermoacetica]|uniref:Phosphoribosylformimino-5-aminoimidazole carboxamide ribonucleotide (ProFAR) isomerase n=1 Tax=Moorella thermoacetica Y72 TaxID=1325331 RepID=A0A0S6UEM6_NEOTH|nr:phosphoribosylformimino-5-aminoimidazole carboxamide ribonucleotide (ProFAR) isomerase [Moorella thermoacetica Y72]GLI16273.1 hypothetical protein MTHERMOG20_07270 [Moorella thermoacetica]
MYAGAPADIKNFILNQIDGLKVYLQKGIKASRGVDVDLVGFGPFKQLVVDGVQNY